MCIRDSFLKTLRFWSDRGVDGFRVDVAHGLKKNLDPAFDACLLYTSDAADERSSVDLGGRRILKKKKQ